MRMQNVQISIFFEFSCLFGCCHCLFAQINHSATNFHLYSTAFSLFHANISKHSRPVPITWLISRFNPKSCVWQQRTTHIFIRIACIKCVYLCVCMILMTSICIAYCRFTELESLVKYRTKQHTQPNIVSVFLFSTVIELM